MILSTNYDVCVCVRVLLGENLISAEALVTAKNINKIFNMHYIYKLIHDRTYKTVCAFLFLFFSLSASTNNKKMSLL